MSENNMDAGDVARMQLIQNEIDEYIEKEATAKLQFDECEAQIQVLKEKMGLLTADRLRMRGAVDALEVMKVKMATDVREAKLVVLND